MAMATKSLPTSTMRRAPALQLELDKQTDADQFEEPFDPPRCIPITRSTESTGNYSSAAEPWSANDTERAQPKISVRLPRCSAPFRRFQVLQQWEGVVIRVADDWFEAELVDLTNPEQGEEFVELPLSEIAKADIPLIVPGGVFYWVIGYATSEGGTITRASEIRARRTPVWSENQLAEVEAKAEIMFNRYSAHGKGKAGYSEQSTRN